MKTNERQDVNASLFKPATKLRVNELFAGIGSYAKRYGELIILRKLLVFLK